LSESNQAMEKLKTQKAGLEFQCRKNSFETTPLRYNRAGVSKLRPAGQIRPAKPFHPAREDILSKMKK